GLRAEVLIRQPHQFGPRTKNVIVRDGSSFNEPARAQHQRRPKIFGGERKTKLRCLPKVRLRRDSANEVIADAPTEVFCQFDKLHIHMLIEFLARIGKLLLELDTARLLLRIFQQWKIERTLAA